MPPYVEVLEAVGVGRAPGWGAGGEEESCVVVAGT